MTPAAAALLAMAITAYLATGLAWSIIVAVVRLVMDQKVTWGGFAAQWLLWPWRFIVSLRGL